MENIVYLFKNPILVIECISVVIATILYFKTQKINLRHFVFFLWYAFLTELLARFFYNLGYKNNLIVYDIYTYVEQVYFYYIFYNYIQHRIAKRIIVGFVVFLHLAYLYNIFILHDNYPIYPSNAFIINQIFLIITIFYFLIEFFLSDQGLHATNYLIFWISVAILFYYITFLPLDTVLRSFSSDSTQLIGKMRTVIVVILYSIYSFGFIWSKEKY